VDELKALLVKILPFALIAVVLIGIGILIQSQVHALAYAMNAAANEQLAIAQAEARLQILLQYKANESILKERMARAERLIPVEAAEGTLVKDIQATADLANTKFVQVRFDKYIPGQEYTTIPLQISFEGRYQGLLVLLDSLRDRSRAVRVDEIRIGQGNQALPQIKADIKANAFCRAGDRAVQPAKP
jgi:Tfp pilus assembly protein PilO